MIRKRIFSTVKSLIYKYISDTSSYSTCLPANPDTTTRRAGSKAGYLKSIANSNAVRIPRFLKNFIK